MRHITIAAYSPTGVSRRLAETLAGYLSTGWEVLDFTDAEVRGTNYFFNQEDLMIFAVPSIKGRLPEVEGGIFDRIYANDTPGIFLATYTGRTYGDMLLELAQNAEDRGVVGIGAAALPVFQSTQGLEETMAEERARLKTFADTMCRICREMELTQDYVDSHSLRVSGHFPYREFEESYIGNEQADGKGEYFCMRPNKLRSRSRLRTK